MAKSPVTKSIPVDELVLDAGTQSRVAISEETVEAYVEVLEKSGAQWPFPELDVFHDGSRYLAADGFHRALAARRSGRASVPCRIHQGTSWDALLFGMTANDTHGLRPTQADKRRCVEVLLDSGKRLTQAQIADIAGVSRRTVERIVAERKPPKSDNVGFVDNPSDPFGDDDDPFTSPPVSRSGGTEELPPPPSTESDAEAVGDGSGGEERDPKEVFRLQKAKAVKTVEALMRAIDDLNDLKRRRNEHQQAIDACKSILESARNW